MKLFSWARIIEQSWFSKLCVVCFVLTGGRDPAHVLQANRANHDCTSQHGDHDTPKAYTLIMAAMLLGKCLDLHRQQTAPAHLG